MANGLRRDIPTVFRETVRWLTDEVFVQQDDEEKADMDEEQYMFEEDFSESLRMARDEFRRQRKEAVDEFRRGIDSESAVHTADLAEG